MRRPLRSSYRSSPPSSPSGSPPAARAAETPPDSSVFGESDRRPRRQRRGGGDRPRRPPRHRPQAGRLPPARRRQGGADRILQRGQRRAGPGRRRRKPGSARERRGGRRAVQGLAEGAVGTYYLVFIDDYFSIASATRRGAQVAESRSRPPAARRTGWRSSPTTAGGSPCSRAGRVRRPTSRGPSTRPWRARPTASSGVTERAELRHRRRVRQPDGRRQRPPRPLVPHDAG